MSLISYKRGQGSIILRVKILNSSVSTGAGLTGLTSASSGLRIGTIADNEETATAYTVAGSTIETIATLGTYATPTATKCRFREVDATNHPGVYEIHLDDARYAVSGAKSLLVSISGATNAAECDAVVPLVDLDPYVSAQDALKLAPTAGTPADGSVNADLDAIKAKTDLITTDGVTVTVANPVAPDGETLNLVIGDDYTTSGDDARPWVINVPTSSVAFVEGDIASVKLVIRDQQSEAVLFTSTGTASEQTVSAVQVFQATGDITAANSGLLTRGRKTALFDLTFILNDGTRVSPITDGYVNVSGGGDLS